MNKSYWLMHKDTICAALLIDVSSWQIENASLIEQSYAPFNGHASTDLLKKWWDQRAVPANRIQLQEIIRGANCSSREEYLVKNLALSITDTYWLCPTDMDLKWDDVSLANWKRSSAEKIPYHNATSYDANASLGGQMTKYWDISGDHPVLIKLAFQYYGQQAVNEAFATMIHERQHTHIPFTSYSISSKENGFEAKCEAFTTPHSEFVSAYEILEGAKIKNENSLYNAYIDICTSHGIDADQMREFMDYQTMTDFLITNTDEHLSNFGVLRDVDTMEFLSPAPIFDSGNSMFYQDTRRKPMERYELLDRPITSFHSKEEKMLMHVTNKNLIQFELLPSKHEVLDYYSKHGIPEEKAFYIAENYSKKIEMLRDFVHGRRISMYLEKKTFSVMSK